MALTNLKLKLWTGQRKCQFDTQNQQISIVTFMENCSLHLGQRVQKPAWLGVMEA